MTFKTSLRALCIGGLEISQRHKPGALCVTEMQDRGGLAVHNCHWVVRFLETLPAGTRLTELTARLTEIVHAVSRRHNRSPGVLVNATGKGKSVVEQLESKVGRGRFYTIYFNQGDRRVDESDFQDYIVTVGKAYLVSAVQTALQTERLHFPRSAEFDQPAEELLNFEIDLPPDANERYGSFRVGTRDELVNALGLTVQHKPGPTTAIGGPEPSSFTIDGIKVYT
ncbi:MAG: hypothetical protein AAGF23_26480 [Acidobacteriota bacterium]